MWPMFPSYAVYPISRLVLCGFLAWLIVMAFSCKKIKTTRPECSGKAIALSIDTSFVSTPLVIPAALIADKVNSVIKQNFYHDDDFDNIDRKGKKDNIKLDIQRLRPIEITWKDNVATCDATLHIQIEKRLINTDFIPNASDIALKSEFTIRAVLQITADITEDWHLKTQTKLLRIDWLTNPVAMGGLLDLKKQIEKKLVDEMPFIAQRIDETIYNGVRLDRAMTRVWKKVQKPIRINKKGQLVWLKIHPIRFEMGRITSKGDELRVQTRFSATTETWVEDHPAYSVDSILPPLVKKGVLPDSAFVYMLSEVPYSDINRVLDKKLSGQKFSFSGRDFKISKADVSGCGQNLVLHLKVKGDIRGDLYLQGRPRFESATQRLMIDNFDFDIQTEEALVSGASWLLHSTFLSQIQEELRVPVGEKMAVIPDKIMEGIERGDAGKKIDLLIEDWHFRPHHIWVRENDLAALIIVHANVRVELEKL